MTQDNPQQTVLAYLAGIIDGEGCIRIAKLSGKHYSPYAPCVNCGMTNPAAIELLHATFGGSIRWAWPSGKNASPCKPLRYWYLNGTESVARALRLLYPHLRVKKAQATLLLDFCFNKQDGRKGGITQDEHRWREELYLKVKKLNHRGVAATTEFSDPEKGCDSLASQETVRELSEAVAPTA